MNTESKLFVVFLLVAAIIIVGYIFANGGVGV